MLTHTASAPTAARPPIHLSEHDCDLIAALALATEHTSPGVSRLLLEEVDRATLHSIKSLPRNVVALGSEVEFIDENSGTARSVRVVVPAEADIHAARISILTPIGAGLIGLAEGQEIEWPSPDGHTRRLRIVKVDQNPG